MKVMVIGSGGREHALVWKIAQSRRVEKIYAVPGNPGMESLAEAVDIESTNIVELADFAKEEGIDLTVVGPELPLSLGIVDEFNKRNLRIFGPTLKAATLECSKSFSKEFMKNNSIPTADFQMFTRYEDAEAYLKTAKYPLVVKADGLAAGKGVFICKEEKEAVESIVTIMKDSRFGKAGESVVIEEFLDGQEMSFMVISDGKRVVPLVTAMDYKKALENDEGPNTGGMGAISPAPMSGKELNDEVMRTVIYPVIEGMKRDGREFRGLLYAGIMISDGKPYVLEFNVRFGDPETQPVLMRLKSDLVDLLEASADGNLFDVPVEWHEKVSAGVVLVSKGYPGKFEKGFEIKGLQRAQSMGAETFHAGTVTEDGKLKTNGGRVLNVCATGDTLKDTMKSIYDAISFISFDNLSFRKDIGRQKHGS